MRFSAALLAGGRSSRMGTDKAFAQWRGMPLWQVQVEKLLALRPEKLIVAARVDQHFGESLAQLSGRHTGTTLRRVDDPPGDSSGPMGAIVRSLRAAGGPLLVLAVDMPLMTVEFLRDQLLGPSGETTAVVWRGEHGYESLAAVYVPAMMPLFEEAMMAGDFAIHRVIDAAQRRGWCRALEIPPDQKALFANVNSPEDASRFLDFQS